MLEQAREDWFGTAKEAVRSVLVSRAFAGLSEEKRDEIRDELQVLLELVTEVHEPRLALLASTDLDLIPLLDEILSATLPGDSTVKAAIGAGRWYEWETTAGTLHLLDARDEVDFKAFRYDLPDVVLQPVPVRLTNDELEAVLERFRNVDDALEAYGAIAPLVAAILPETRGADDILAMRMRDRLSEAADEYGVPIHVVVAHADSQLAEEIAPLLPQGARFPWARLTPARSAQTKMADRAIGIAASISATIASVPLPLASTIPITTVQVLMIAAIAWLSGRERSLKTVAEFLAAVGVGVGATYAVRELARALTTLIPVAGPVVSAGIAASSTLAIGEAAKRHFLA